MATTTNYGWTTPDDTALVKDGASAIRTLGSSVDTTTKALNPSTTLGDIEYRSSTANTNTRLGIGTTGQVLSVSGGVPAWATISAGGMTLLSTTTLSGATTTISSINQTYTNLFISVYGHTNATADGYLLVLPNNLPTSTTSVSQSYNTSGGNALLNAELLFMPAIAADKMLRTDANNSFGIIINNYASTTYYKSFDLTGGFVKTVSGNNATRVSGYITTNSAITSLVFQNTGGNLSTGTVLVYGVK